MTPLVSISESRLGLMTNSSMPRDSASDVLASSTSRRVSPVCSRSSRNFLPAESTIFALPPPCTPRPDTSGQSSGGGSHNNPNNHPKQLPSSHFLFLKSERLIPL